jgi:hypothetical protein
MIRRRAVPIDARWRDVFAADPIAPASPPAHRQPAGMFSVGTSSANEQRVTEGDQDEDHQRANGQGSKFVLFNLGARIGVPDRVT